MLPFVLAPAPVEKRRVGTSATGVLEIPVLGGLTVCESNTIAELLDSHESTLASAAKLADAIAVAEEITISEAFKIVEDTVSGRPMEPAADTIRLKYASSIEDIYKVYRNSSRQTAEATVTAIIRHRLDRPNWNVDDTRTLLKPLFDGIYALALDEQEAEDMPSSPVSEEDLKKPLPESPRPSKRTGAKSSGT